MKPSSLLCMSLLALGPLSCAPADAPDQAVGAASSPIIGGVTDPNHPAVVGIVINTPMGTAMCSGTLITPTVVVTAAHCVADTAIPGNYSVFFGTDIFNGPGTMVGVKQVAFNPLYNPTQITNDIGVVVLAQPASIAPMPYRQTPLPSTFVGQQVTLVGFGVNDGVNQTGSGLKRTAVTTVSGFDPMGAPAGTQFQYGNSVVNSCNGDSGGPAFWNIGGVETLVGITSYGDQFCQQFGADTRIDAYLSFLAPFVNVSPGPGCQANGACVPGCNPPDPDCLLLGRTCGSNTICESQLCGTARDGLICTQLCGAGSPACPPSFVCVSDAGNTSVCVPLTTACGPDGHCLQGCSQPDPDCLPAGSVCGINAACQSNLCLPTPTSSGAVCVTPCNPAAANSCASGQCISDNYNNHFCSTPAQPTTGGAKAVGASCATNSDCASGQCLAPPTAAGSICVTPCSPAASACPGSQTCGSDGLGHNYCADPPSTPPPSGGCLGCSSRGEEGPFGLLGLLLLVGLGAGRRRRE